MFYTLYLSNVLNVHDDWVSIHSELPVFVSVDDENKKSNQLFFYFYLISSVI